MKSWHESKSIWPGLATIVTAVVSAVAGGAGVLDPATGTATWAPGTFPAGTAGAPLSLHVSFGYPR